MIVRVYKSDVDKGEHLGTGYSGNDNTDIHVALAQMERVFSNRTAYLNAVIKYQNKDNQVLSSRPTLWRNCVKFKMSESCNTNIQE